MSNSTNTPKTSWIVRLANWYHELSERSDDVYFVNFVIRGTLILLIAVPIFKLIQFFIIFMNSTYPTPNRPLL